MTAGDRQATTQERPSTASMKTPIAAVTLTTVVTAVAGLESLPWWPWAPFPFAHCVAAVVVPILLAAAPSGRPIAEVRVHVRRQRAPLFAAAAFVAAFVVGYGSILELTGRLEDPHWNLFETYRLVAELTVDRHGRVPSILLTYVLLGIWPMFGEELLYRGLLLGSLMRGGMGAVTASAVTSTLFGLRHCAQLLFLWPDYPVVAGVAYFVWAFAISLLLCWVFVRTRSLWMCMAAHGVNLVLAPAVIAVLAP